MSWTAHAGRPGEARHIAAHVVDCNPSQAVSFSRHALISRGKRRAIAAVRELSVLDWATQEQVSNVARQELPGLGWALLATSNIEEGTSILKVPLDIAITSDGAEEDSWSAHMAAALLEQVALGAAAPAAPWVSSLPAHVPLPWLYWAADELEELQEEDTIEEAFHMRGKFEQACQVRWAVQWCNRALARARRSPHCFNSTQPPFLTPCRKHQHAMQPSWRGRSRLFTAARSWRAGGTCGCQRLTAPTTRCCRTPSFGVRTARRPAKGWRRWRRCVLPRRCPWSPPTLS